MDAITDIGGIVAKGQDSSLGDDPIPAVVRHLTVGKRCAPRRSATGMRLAMPEAMA